MTQQGVVLCAAVHPSYLAKAWLTARSIRQVCPDLPVTVCTDLFQLPLARSAVFAGVVRLRTETEDFGSSWVNGKVKKIDALLSSPYERTLYMDVDAQVLSADLASVFDWLDRSDIAMVEAQADDSYTRAMTGLRCFNAGVIAYRNNLRVGALLSMWRMWAHRHHRFIRKPGDIPIPWLSHITDHQVRSKLLAMDQVALMRLLRPDMPAEGMTAETLPDRFNVRVPRPGMAPVIQHLRNGATHSDQEFVRVAQQAIAAQDPDAERLLDCLKRMSPPRQR